MTDKTDAPNVRVLNAILERIKTGQWPPGTQIPPESELADVFLVHRSTVARATRMLRYLGFLTGPAGGRIWIAGRAALRHAWTAHEEAKKARELNRPD